MARNVIKHELFDPKKWITDLSFQLLMGSLRMHIFELGHKIDVYLSHWNWTKINSLKNENFSKVILLD